VIAKRAEGDTPTRDSGPSASRSAARDRPPPVQPGRRSLAEFLQLQQMAGNLAVAQLLGGRRRATPRVQRDEGRAPFSPAPAAGVTPPSPPVPGSPEDARAEALRVGAGYGTLMADIEAGLGVVMKKWAGRSTWDTMKPEEKNDWVNKAAQRFAQLPTLQTSDKPEFVAAQDEGFRTGFISSYDLGRATTFLANLGTDVVVALIVAVAATGWFARFLSRLLTTARVVIGGEGETMTLYRYCKEHGDVLVDGWWTTRQAASRADAARLTGVPENECLYEQSITVNAAPSKYGPYFRNSTPRLVGESLIEEFRNKVAVPQVVIKVRPMNN
jgi:hypothetical protein